MTVAIPLKYLAAINQTVLDEGTAPDYEFRYVDIGSVASDGSVAVPDEAVLFGAAPSRARRIAPPGATAISTVRTYLRAIAHVPHSDEALVFSTGFAIAEPLDGVDHRYLYYACRSDPFVDEVVARSVGVSYPAINPSDLACIPVPVRELCEQRRIADFLDDQVGRIDSLVAARRHQLTLVDQARRSERATTLAGYSPTMDMHPLLGPVHAGWPIRRVKDVVRRVGVGVVVNPSSYFVDDGVPFLHGGNVREGRIDLTEVKMISPHDSNVLWRSRLDADDVVVVRAGYPGRAAVVPAQLEGANCASMLLIKTAPARVLPKWLELFFNSPQGRAQVSLAQYGAAQEQINVGDVVDFVLPVPGVDMQRKRLEAHAVAAERLNGLRRAIEAQASSLDDLKRSLITAAVTGEFDVSSSDGSPVPV